MSHYATRLHEAVRAKGTPVLVGLDPRYDRLPEPVRHAAEKRNVPDRPSLIAGAFEEFCYRIIDVVAPLVPAVKPQTAFFEEQGPAGCLALQRVIRRARDAGLIVICDAKRGDIGSTAEAYARGYLAGSDPDSASWGADALTVNPYLGEDSLQPLVNVAEDHGAGIYVLVRTSNPGAKDFQDRQADFLPGEPRPVYRHVAHLVERLAAATTGDGGYGCVGAVVGATWPEELSELRQAMPRAPLLVPGYGAQGAGAGEVAGAFDADGFGALINSSRGIIFAHSRSPDAGQYGPDQWEQAVEAATRRMIAELAEQSPAGRLRDHAV